MYVHNHLITAAALRLNLLGSFHENFVRSLFLGGIGFANALGPQQMGTPSITYEGKQTNIGSAIVVRV